MNSSSWGRGPDDETPGKLRDRVGGEGLKKETRGNGKEIDSWSDLELQVTLGVSKERGY